tara:strand:- start:139 stop:690 length:552 start_codon:yes stop_codon:yes gene_type:complete
MAYDIKDVFYLDTTATITAATGNGGSAQLDLSAYIDPIARGRQKGTGLAIYKVHFMFSDDANSKPIRAAETGVCSFGMIAGLGIGDNATGAIALGNDALTADNQLFVAGGSFYSPGAASTTGMNVDVMPSEKVPYVIVRDNVCLVYSVQDNFVNTSLLSVRMECAQVTLDQATLNQLLRTQTV